MSGICENRVVAITGAGGGLGRSYALAFAQAGARVIVNDINQDAAGAVVEEILSMDGAAIINGDDITDHEAAGRIVASAVETFGDLHVVINNAGICRDRMFATMSPQEWDDVIRIHLRGHFCLSSNACAHWRAQHKRGAPVDARIINTSSGAGLQGSIGQSNYAAAKAGIAALTLVQAAELKRYGITANALAPSARTGMTLQVPAFAEQMKAPEDDSFDVFSPDNIAPLIVWLGSTQSKDVSGQVFEAVGSKISLADGWRTGKWQDKGAARWSPEEIGPAVARLLAESESPQPVYGA